MVTQHSLAVSARRPLPVPRKENNKKVKHEKITYSKHANCIQGKCSFYGCDNNNELTLGGFTARGIVTQSALQVGSSTSTRNVPSTNSSHASLKPSFITATDQARFALKMNSLYK